MVLVDTSIWIDHFHRGDSHLADLLNSGQVVTHPFVIGELACGNLMNHQTILDLLQALSQVKTLFDDEVLAFMDRHTLHGKGLGLIDMHLLASSFLNHVSLWTRDKTLAGMATILRVVHQH